MTNKLKFWIALSILVAFVAGVLGGVFGERYYSNKRRHARIARSQRTSVHFPSLEQMAQELGLSAEQQDKIKKIFEENEARLKELRSDMHTRLSGIRSELKNQIDAVLTAEQRQKMESIIEKYMQRRKDEFEQRRQNLERERPHDESKGDLK